MGELTGRKREVYDALSSHVGMGTFNSDTMKEVAAKLNIGFPTFRSYVSEMLHEGYFTRIDKNLYEIVKEVKKIKKATKAKKKRGPKKKLSKKPEEKSTIDLLKLRIEKLKEEHVKKEAEREVEKIGELKEITEIEDLIEESEKLKEKIKKYIG
ncbi:MAG TPA: hypothetical protein DIT25_01610 [Candidatus Moranbacteria bacterium]|nr:hypothetical protein [Candidatus Moranbacteria bacterium]